MSVELEGGLKQLEQPATELLGFGGIVDAHLHDRELVAADAGDRIDLAHAGAQRAPHLLEQEIAGRVAQGVVDVLEAVEVQQQQRRHVAAPAHAGDRLIEPLKEQTRLGSPVRASCMARYSARRPASISAVMSVAVPR